MIGSFLAALLLASAALMTAWLGFTAVPRETCEWRDSDFCSDYGDLYIILSFAFVLALAILLWAINRKRRVS